MCVRRLFIVLIMCGVSPVTLMADQDEGEKPSADILLVIGAPGADEYGEQFSRWAHRWKDFAEQSRRQLEVIGEATDRDESDRELLQEAIRRRVEESNSPFLIVLIGHGTHLRGTSKFNLRGPDVTDRQLAQWLAEVKRPVAIVQCASSSAPFLRTISGENRIVITATRSQSEQNFSRFGDHFSSAIRDPNADLDHDYTVSLLEAFLLASHHVAEFYRQDSRLATEHSLLDDNADQLGSSATFFRGIRAKRAAKDGAALDGLRAHQVVLFRLPGHTSLNPELIAQRDLLEGQIELLRQGKAEMSEDEYFEQLEPLMVKLARIYESQNDVAQEADVQAPETEEESEEKSLSEDEKQAT